MPETAPCIGIGNHSNAMLIALQTLVVALQDNKHFCLWLQVLLHAVMHPYKCNVIGGLFELKQYLEYYSRIYISLKV